MEDIVREHVAKRKGEVVTKRGRSDSEARKEVVGWEGRIPQ